MLNMGVNLFVFSLVSGLVINIIMLMKYLSRSQQAGLAIGEIFHTLFTGFMLKSYRDLLIKDGIKPTTLDELLYRMSIILVFSTGCGIVLILSGLVWSN